MKNKINLTNLNNIFVVFFFVIFLFIGFYVYKDYGISSDELYARFLGLVSLNYVTSLLFPDFTFNFQNTNLLPDLHNFEWKANGVFYEMLLVVIENILNFKNFNEILHLRHLINFLFFFIANIFFYLIIKDLYNNNFLAITGTFFLFFTPRIFANSFYNNKDLVFLSFLIITLYFLIRIFKNFNLKNIIFFTLFSSISISIRVMGIYIPLLFIVFYFFECLKYKEYFFKSYKNLLIFIALNILFTILFWPFLWSSPLENFIIALKSYSHFPWDGNVFYLGEFIKSTHLPWHYSLVWILVTTPIGMILLFLIGFFVISVRFCSRFVNMSYARPLNDIWSSKNEKINLFIFVIFIFPIFSVIALNSVLYNGWRHLYFIYPFFILLSIYGIAHLFKIFRNNKFKSYLKILIISFLISNIYNVIKLHPFQNVYFNILFESKANKYFDIDYWGISNKHVLEKIYELAGDKDKVTVGIASFTPLRDSLFMLDKKISNKIDVTGTNISNEDFIFTNYYYEINPKFTKKYHIPDNYIKIYSLKRGNVLINDLYIKK